MLSFGWPEMLIVAAAALIVVGPRDLPVLLRNIGRILGKVRRMGNDFKSEINKVAALDDIKDIKQQITQPIADTRTEIEQEFNKINLDGSVEPSGKIKPKNPEATSVYDEIVNASAKQEPSTSISAKESMKGAVTKAMKAKKEQELALKEKIPPKAKKTTKSAKTKAVKKPSNTTSKKIARKSKSSAKKAIKQDG